MDNIIKTNSKDLKRFPIVSTNGNFANIYRYDDKSCLKIWKEDLDYNISKFNRFSNMNINCAAFPEKLVFVDNSFKGFTMQYIDGICMKDCCNFDFSFVLNKFYSLILEQIDELGENRILIGDVYSENIMWDKKSNRFVAIDVDNWDLLSLTKGIVNNYNFGEMVQFFASFIFDNGNPYYCDDAFNMNISMDFIDFYESMRYDLQKESDTELRTVTDVRQYLRRM